jgi:hydrogenase maturation protease
MTTLVIGYGNESRGDDGLGPAVARTIDAMNLPNVSVLIEHQLTPELAEPLSLAGRVLFIDANAASQLSPIAVRLLQPAGGPAALTHACSPGTLLALSQLLYGRSPPAWLVTIAGDRFDPGDSLSTRASERMIEATKWITAWLRSAELSPEALEILS